MTYSLYRTRDGAGDSGGSSIAITPVYDESTGEFLKFEYEIFSRPREGVAMQVGSITARTYSGQDYWQTTVITKILREWNEDGADCVEFETGNSTYIWKHF